MDLNIKRMFSPYNIKTWSVFINPLETEEHISELVKTSKCPINLVQKLSMNLKNTHVFKSLIQKHIEVTNTFEICKKSLVRLFRAIGCKIMPVEILGNKSNLEKCLRNLNMIFMAGRGTNISGSDLTRHLDLTYVAWTENEENVAIFLLFLAEKIFWRLLKSFFHVTDTVASKNEIMFYHKSDFQGLVDSTFHKLKQEEKLRPVNQKLAQQISKEFSSISTFSKCRLLPKTNLKSFRMITRKAKISSEKNETETDMRHLLEMIVREYFPGTVDVKGELFCHISIFISVQFFQEIDFHSLMIMIKMCYLIFLIFASKSSNSTVSSSNNALRSTSTWQE